MTIPPSIRSIVEQKIKSSFKESVVGGGSINEAFRLDTGARSYFLKVNSAVKFPQLFRKEADGLAAIRQTGTIRVPDVYECFTIDDRQALLMEWIEPGERTPSFWKLFGEQLAALHRHTDTAFGFLEDNYMGSVVQDNSRARDWNEFFIENRLEPLLYSCLEKGLLNQEHLRSFERLFTKLPDIFETIPTPTLVHGDLWSGNFVCDAQSRPVLIDPAVYYGHPAVDLGLTRLFSGFAPDFYEAYRHHSPATTDYAALSDVCNLYPLLLHLLLFGSSYLPRIESILRTTE
ncbi:MAG TPA: fructosamine kinase family protein [Flavisolibacter sp.]|jgi:fructosamine-3-kinase|nr:fructosamine kinase family protein [Flavisolibacter sp.]